MGVHITTTTMASLPYPSFVNQLPVDAASGRAALAAVGRCCVYPESCIGNNNEYRAIVDKCIEQSQVVVNTDDDKEEQNEKKKLKKKLMKQGVAMAKKYLIETLGLDVSVLDVQVVVCAKDLLNTDGCLASCLLDAGCAAIATTGTELKAMDAAKIPRDRIVAHLQHNSDFAALEKAFIAVSPLASVVTVGLSTLTCPQAAADIITLGTKENDTSVVIQLSYDVCQSFANNEELALCVGEISKQCKDGRSGVSLVDPTAQQLGLSYAACMRTDRADGLYTTVVCTRNGEALGLVYSSKVRRRSYNVYICYTKGRNGSRTVTDHLYCFSC